jgi:hypothetical protein
VERIGKIKKEKREVDDKKMIYCKLESEIKKVKREGEQSIVRVKDR